MSYAPFSSKNSIRLFFTQIQSLYTFLLLLSVNQDDQDTQLPTIKPMNIRKELLDELLQECKTPPDLFGEGGILKQLTTALVERALEAELSTHLGYKKHETARSFKLQFSHSDVTLS